MTDSQRPSSPRWPSLTQQQQYSAAASAINADTDIDNDNDSPPPSYLWTLGHKASQFSLRSFHRHSPAPSPSRSPVLSRPSTPAPARTPLLPTTAAHADAALLRLDNDNDEQEEEDTTLRPLTPSTERSRLFPSFRFGRSRRQDYGAAIRLEENDDDDAPLSTMNLSMSNANVAATRTATRRPQSRLRGMRRWFAQRPVLRAGLEMGAIFILSTLVMGSILWIALPKLEECVTLISEPTNVPFHVILTFEIAHTHTEPIDPSLEYRNPLNNYKTSMHSLKNTRPYTLLELSSVSLLCISCASIFSSISLPPLVP